MGGKKSKVDPTEFIRDCPNGRLDKKKFLQLYERCFPEGNAKNYCKYAFDAFDQNDDGTIDFTEFLFSIAITSGGDLDTRLTAAFDLYDISNDEQVDQKELVKMITALYQLHGKAIDGAHDNPKTRAAEILAALDINNDRKLSKHEFIAGFVHDCPNGQVDKKKFVEACERFAPGKNADNLWKRALDAFQKTNHGTIVFKELVGSIATTKEVDIDQRLSGLFDIYDTSEDGQIDQNELIGLITALYKLSGTTDQSSNNNPKTRADEIIATYDINNNRKLSRQEFITAYVL
ncbi:unnamed protein product [Rotaria sp. Silwood1]|nr:unnamed protein product [Rotaria sp. Silwood1]CAF3764584.1 unnamed protein product [Rotaria sp. Silwood1]